MTQTVQWKAPCTMRKWKKQAEVVMSVVTSEKENVEPTIDIRVRRTTDHPSGAGWTRKAFGWNWRTPTNWPNQSSTWWTASRVSDMLLSLATQVARTLRKLHYGRGSGDSGEDFRQSLSAITELMEACDGDYEDIVDIFYPRHSKHPPRFVTDGWVKENVCAELAISPLCGTRCSPANPSCRCWPRRAKATWQAT